MVSSCWIENFCLLIHPLFFSFLFFFFCAVKLSTQNRNRTLLLHWQLMLQEFQMWQIQQGHVLESTISSSEPMHNNKVIMMPVSPIKVMWAPQNPSNPYSGLGASNPNIISIKKKGIYIKNIYMRLKESCLQFLINHEFLDISGNLNDFKNDYNTCYN